MARWIGRIKIAGAAIRGLRSAGLRGVAEIVTFIIPARSPQPVDRGLFRAGWKSLPTNDGCTIENMEPHAIFIEHGVKNIRVGRKMIDALAEWAVRKGITDKANARRVALSLIHI